MPSRSRVVADTSRLAIARSYDVQMHQERLAMPSMRAKIEAQGATLPVVAPALAWSASSERLPTAMHHVLRYGFITISTSSNTSAGNRHGNDIDQ
jgi:hypothetical protein